MSRLILAPCLLLCAPLAEAAAPTSAQYEVHLRRFEGYRTEPYRDGPRSWTVGIGHSLTAHGEQVKASYTDAEVIAFYRVDVATAIRTCRANVLEFDTLPDAVQITAVSIAFTVGPTGFARWASLRTALSRRDWPGAATAIRASKWATQVQPARVEAALDSLRAAQGEKP